MAHVKTRRGRARPRTGGLPQPAVVEVGARTLRVGGGWCATLAVVGYPSEVGPAWLNPLATYPGHLDISVQVEPVPPPIAADRLRKQRARLESGRRREAATGRLDDPETAAAAEDARELAYQIATGAGKLFRTSLYLTVYAASEKALEQEIAAVRALTDAMLLRTVPATFRALQGWTSNLPLATDNLGMARTLDTAALAACFPMASPDLPPEVDADAGAGMLFGANLAGPGLVSFDPWAQHNHNMVVLGRSGSGKSFFTKMVTLRNLFAQVSVRVIDPDNEYTRLAHAVGGSVVDLGDPDTHLNPFDLPIAAARAARSGGGLARRAMFAHTALSVLLGVEFSAGERGVLDRAILAAYHAAGISDDPRTWTRPAPLLGDVHQHLATMGLPAAEEMASRLEPYVSGSHSGLFAAPSTVRPNPHLTVYSIRNVPDELRPIVTLLVLDATWREVTDPADARRRLVVVDEAWQLLHHDAGARWLFRMAKSARKYRTGLCVVSQDADDVLSSTLGRAVVSNAATQVLFRQAPQVIDQVVDAFGLSAGERAMLLSAGQGDALLSAGAARVTFHALASQTEAELATTGLSDTDPDFDIDEP